MEQMTHRGTGGRTQAPDAAAHTQALLVDDHVEVARVLRTILSLDLPAMQVEIAGNGLEAVELFTRTRHALVMLDLHMPVMDGGTAFRTIRQLCLDRRWTMPAVIFWTGFAPPEAVRRYIDDDPTLCVLRKPFSAEELVAAVRDSLPCLAA